MKKNNLVEILAHKPTGAKFFKCALQVNPYSYAKYKGLNIPDELSYNQKILDKCIEGKISVLGLADHGDINESERLRRFLEKNGIIVFPGFELTSSEKVHLVCLFPSDYETHKLNQILGALQGEAVKDNEKTYPSTQTLLTIAKLVEKHQGIWYAAHMTGDNGLLKLHKDGGGLKHIWIEEKYVLAGQIPESIDDLEDKYKLIILNKNSDYKRINSISVLNAKDIEKPETLLDSRATCLIKMDSPTIEALRQAFIDGSSRIRLNDQLDNRKRSYIKAIKLESSFFGDGLILHFNENLNSIIGGRGTGKSTLLECIRYGLDLPYHSIDSKNIADGILSSNLSDGKVTIIINSQKFEKEFLVERHYRQPVIVKDETGSISPLSVKDILPYTEFFGQNEIYEISNDKSYHLQLLKRFLPEETRQSNLVLQKLRQNRNKILQVVEKIDELEVESNQLNRLKEEQKLFQEKGLLNKFKELDKYQVENSRIIQRSLNDIENLNEVLENLKESTGIDIQYLSTESIKELINKDVFSLLEDEWKNLISDFKTHVKSIEDSLNKYSKSINKLTKDWEKRFAEFQKQFDQTIRTLPEIGGLKGSELAKRYDTISKKIAAIEGANKKLEQEKKLRDQLLKERISLLSELDDLLLDNFKNIFKVCKSLSKNELFSKLLIECEKGAERNQLKEFLQKLSGIGEKKIEWLDKASGLTIRQLVMDIKKGKEILLDNYKSFGLTQATADILVSMSHQDLLELEEVIFYDIIKIKLNVGTKESPVYKDIENLSSGQKCTAILHLLLLDNTDPLIVDQPEDNLDNAFIAENIVQELRQQKEKRQFIFSTHNANIPVFGDAEWIGVVEMHESTSEILDENVGSIDKQSLKPRVEEILEGGKRAFEIRRLKYGF